MKLWLATSMFLLCLEPMPGLAGTEMLPAFSPPGSPRRTPQGDRRAGDEGSSAGNVCTCATLKERGGWCDACKVGYVAAVRIDSEALFHAIDAHGHDIRPDSFRCTTCRKMIASDGFCGSCKTGFVNGQAYFSRLTYLLATGTVRPAGKITCAKCRTHLSKPGWCEPCGVGMVGHVAFKNKEKFLRAKLAYEGLLAAVATVPKCLSCAVAMAVDRSCRRCKKTYLHGKPVPPDQRSRP